MCDLVETDLKLARGSVLGVNAWTMAPCKTRRRLVRARVFEKAYKQEESRIPKVVASWREMRQRRRDLLTASVTSTNDPWEDVEPAHDIEPSPRPLEKKLEKKLAFAAYDKACALRKLHGAPSVTFSKQLLGKTVDAGDAVSWWESKGHIPLHEGLQKMWDSVEKDAMYFWRWPVRPLIG